MTVEGTNDASSQEHAIRRMTRLVNYIERKGLDWTTKNYKLNNTTPEVALIKVKPFGVK